MSDSTDTPEYLAAICGVCGTRVTPKAKHAGRKVKCPDCYTPIPIPTLEQHQQRRAEEVLHKPIQPKQTTGYTLREQIEIPEPRMSFAREQARIRRVKRPKPPKSTFFSNVFEFPWKTSDALSRWICLTIGLTLNGLIWSINMWMLNEYGSGGMIGVGFFLLAQIAFATWSLAYAASCSFAIIQDTASGLHQIEGWSDEGLRDWMSELVAALCAFLVSGFVSYIPAKLLSYGIGVLTPQLFLIHALLFPAALLSSLDSRSLLLPWSDMIFRSLSRIPGHWLLCYFLIGLIWVSVGGVLLAAALFSYWLGGLLSGPLLASAIFISARLLGRLGWKIGDDASRLDEDDDD